MDRQRSDIAIFGNLDVRGGGSRVFVNNIKEWVADGLTVELVGYRQAAPIFPEELPEQVRFHHLGTNHNLTTSFALWLYVLKYRPRVLVGSSHRSNLLLCHLARFPSHETRIWLTVHQDFVYSGKRSGREKARKLAEVKRYYPNANGIICVSKGAADNLKEATLLPENKVHAVHNAVLDSSVMARAAIPVQHPWLDDPCEKVFIAVGRLAEQKDFGTLISAFGKVRKQVKSRLIILGEGPERKVLEQQIQREGLVQDVELKGFVENPYSWIARSDVFVSSSRWEGFGNVIAEALGIGLPIVSTDCPSGPSEILCEGRYGELVPVQDSEALASGMIRAMESEHNADTMKDAATRFWAKNTAPQYLRLFGLE